MKLVQDTAPYTLKDLDQSKWIQAKETDNRDAKTLLLVDGKYYRWIDGKWVEA